MTDREMLELAAKAADLKVKAWWERYPGEWWADLEVHRELNDPPTVWSPLHDDGDALRLAVRCGICIEFTSCVDDAPVVYCGLDYQRRDWPMTPNFPDPFKATRRAITRAAAEMGKQMGGGDV